MNLYRLPRWLSSKEPACQCKRHGFSLGREDALEKEMATYSRILTWEISWTQEPAWDHKSDTTLRLSSNNLYTRNSCSPQNSQSFSVLTANLPWSWACGAMIGSLQTKVAGSPCPLLCSAKKGEWCLRMEGRGSWAPSFLPHAASGSLPLLLLQPISSGRSCMQLS